VERTIFASTLVLAGILLVETRVEIAGQIVDESLPIVSELLVREILAAPRFEADFS